MGLLQKAFETYENLSHLIGKSTDGVVEFKEPLAPLGHITTTAGIEIAVNNNGHFVSASKVDKKESKIIIPATEDSASRTNVYRPHPLCEYVKHLSPANSNDYRDYVTQLEGWHSSKHSHPMLRPILEYVKNGTIVSDLVSSGLGNIDDKTMVRWIVISPDETESGKCWESISLFEAFSNYYIEQKSETNSVFCMISGKEMPAAEQHIKGISSMNGNAKLISSNDSSNFTFRGRFTEDSQAATIGFESSQKAHNALKWIISNQGVIIGGRTFVCWNPNGRILSRPTNPFFQRNEKPIVTVDQYKKDFSSALHSFKSTFKPNEKAIIAFFDAATTGRLAVTYYNEMDITDFLDRLFDWDVSCCWAHTRFGIEAPSLDRIINCAFGTERGNFIEADERVLKQHLQRLLECKLEGREIPYDIVHALSLKTMSPLAYSNNRDYLQFTACAVIRKYYIDKYKEEYQMALERDKHDLSYQYGRLLAVLEKAEKDTYDNGENRDTYAIRLQSAFCAHPLQTSKNIIEHWKTAYYPKLNAGAKTFYESLIGEIFSIISEFPESSHNSQLKETYILGYYLQKNSFYTKNNNINDTEETENE